MEVIIVIVCLLCFGFIMTLLVSSIFHPVQTNNNPPVEQTVSVTTPTTDSSSSLSEEDSYKQWLKEDYEKWDKSHITLSEFYSLYTGAQAKKPPEKYKEFHQHYVKDYYYLYMARKAAEKNNVDDVGYYTDLASAEFNKMCECMPEYSQIITVNEFFLELNRRFIYGKKKVLDYNCKSIN